MTVSSVVVRAVAVWTGVETEFPTGIQILDKAQLAVSLISDGGLHQVLTLGLHYSITLSPAGIATVVPLGAFPAVPGTVSFVRQTPMTQTYDPTATDTYDAAGHAAALDRSAMRVAELSVKVDDIAASSIIIAGGASTVPVGAVYVSNGEGGAVAGPNAAEIEASRIIAGGYAGTATTAAALATSKAAEAAASATAAALFDPARYYLKTAFKSDGTPNAPVLYDGAGAVNVSGTFRVKGAAAAQQRIEFWVDGVLDWIIYRDVDGSVALYQQANGTAWRVDHATNKVNFTALPTIGGNLNVAYVTDVNKLPAYDASLLVNVPSVLLQTKLVTYTSNAGLTVAIPLDNTKPQITEGTQVLSTTITPKSASSKLRIEFKGTVLQSGGAGLAIAALFVNGGANAVQSAATYGPNTASSALAFDWEYSPGTVAPQTIAVRVGPAIGTMVQLNMANSYDLGSTLITTMTIEEVA